MARAGLPLLLVLLVSSPAAAAAVDADKLAKVSLDRQLRPIFQTHCYGCHQPAKAKGGYVMTVFDRLVAGGESGDRAVAAGDPARSILYKMVVPDADGDAEMPKGKKALSAAEIDLIKRWIAQGAADDTPPAARARYDMEHPPVYTRQPVVTSIDFSPDGRYLAVAGFHEVLIYKADGSERVARLVGLSERIQSVRFSPDGKELAVTGGLPGRTGEVQVWDVDKRRLATSAPVTFDTLYGASWSPDGKKIAFGAGDNTVRAVDAKTGEQVLYQGTHNDWVLGTVFSADGSHVVSVGRDRTAKLTELGSQRFVDNITSITPGALKGGIAAVARHPKRDEIVIGGADGVPKIYRVFRETKRVIGDDSNLVRVLPAMTGRITSVAVSRDGRRIAAGASLDGKGEVHVFSYEFDTKLSDRLKQILAKRVKRRTAEERALIDAYTTAGVKRIAGTALDRGGVYAVAFRPDGRQVAAAGSDGLVRFIDAASGRVVKELAPAPVQAAVAASGNGGGNGKEAGAPDFIRDVNPVLSKLGCNQGTCHGSAQGKNGFKMSLRGYDPIEDVRALTDDLASRRVNFASPDDSLMLLKPTGAVPHEGGVLFKPGDAYYKVVRGWIASGAVLDLETPRVARIELSPQNPVLDKPGARQAMRVVATYADGKTRDVTREAFVESANTEVATADKAGRLTAVRRGEAPVLARYDGAYAATTMTVMGDRSGFVWEQPPAWNKIDELAAEKWKRLKIKPSGLSSDAELIRRVFIDLTGLPPSADQVRAFLADPKPARQKRDALVDKLIGSDAFVEHWTNKWGDLLQVNRKFLGADGAAAFRAWIRKHVAKNTPYDQFARQILTASGSNKQNPAASYYKIVRDPGTLTENTTHLFLAVRFNCNKCHDHPFERWTQDQYYQTAAYFARVGLKADPSSLGEFIGGTAVEGAKPLYEVVFDKDKGEVKHERTGKVTAPRFPYDVKFEAGETASRREQLAAWITSPENPYFARSYVNRLWGYLFGVGIIEPIDDIRAGNPASNPALLDYLTREFVGSGFNMRHVLRLIVTSRTYQLSIATNKWNQDDRRNYSHAMARRLPAEVLYDAVHHVTGSVARAPGVKPGTRAAAFPDAGVELPSGFLATFGRPPRESPCECERTSELRLGAVMSLVSGPTLADAIADPDNALGSLVAREKDDAKLVGDLYLRVLNRPATPHEVTAALGTMRGVDEDHRKLTAALAAREKEIAGARAKQKQERERAIAEAKAALEAYEKEVGASIAERERRQTEEVAQREAELRTYEETLPAKLVEWEKKQRVAGDWVPLAAADLDSTNGSRLQPETDLSVTASDDNGKGDYVFVAETGLRGITGIRLEALAGRGEGGRVVLSGIEVQAAPRAAPGRARRVVLRAPLADFAQASYDFAAVVVPEAKPGDKGKGAAKPKAKGKETAAEAGKAKRRGWSISPSGGVIHWATFETGEPVGFPGGTILTFTLKHDSDRTLGRFRISVTTSPRPVGLGLPDALRGVLSREVEGDDDKQRTIPLMKYLRAIDVELQKRTQALEEARKPLAVDPKLKELRDRLEEVSRPLAEDPKLAQLRDDVEMSEKQVQNKRLTLAQDLAWALLNSPAFLFNR